MNVAAVGVMRSDRGAQVLGGHRPSVGLFTKNTTSPNLGSNTRYRDGKPAPNPLITSMVLCIEGSIYVRIRVLRSIISLHII
jgi:hypothetical protein